MTTGDVIPDVDALKASLPAYGGLPYGNEVMKTLAAVSVLIGALIGISSAEYYKG